LKTITLSLDTLPGASVVCYLQDFMFPGQKRPGAVMCPGGGYNFLNPREGEQMAMTFYSMGYHAFVVRYSTGLHSAWPQPVVEASIALRLIREHAAEWGLDGDKLFIAGFSAGGHVASSTGVWWNDPEVQRLSGCMNGENRPNAMLLAYPCINIEMPVFEDGEMHFIEVKNVDAVGPHTPPAFIVHTWQDTVVSMEQTTRFVHALSANDVKVEYHVYTPGEHCAVMEPSSSDTPDGWTTVNMGAWMPRFKQWLDELWNPRQNPQVHPMMGGMGHGRRAHLDALLCGQRGDITDLPPMPGTPEIHPGMMLGTLLEKKPKAMEVLREYLPTLASLRINEDAKKITLSAWMAYDGLQVGGMMGPGSPEAEACLEKLRAL